MFLRIFCLINVWKKSEIRVSPSRQSFYWGVGLGPCVVYQ